MSYPGMHRKPNQARDAIAAWLHSLPARAELTWRWCHWKLIAHPRYVRALRGALSAPTTPAPAEAPGQAPRPADPSRSGGAARCGPGQLMTPGAVADGTGPDAGDAPSPAAAATIPPGGAALPPPAPPRGFPGRGQPSTWVITQPPPGTPTGQDPFSAPAYGILPDKKVAVTGHGTARIRGLAWEGHARETGGMPALVRPAARRRFEHVDDAAGWIA